MIDIKATESNKGFFSIIKKCTCDVCGTKDISVVVSHQWHSPTYAECKTCNPMLFQDVSEAQKDAWLNGK